MKMTMIVERFVHNYFTIVVFQALSFLIFKEGEL